MRSKVLAAGLAVALTLPAMADAAPTTLFDTFVTADNLVAAPLGAASALAGPLGLVGGLQSGPIIINVARVGTLTVTVADIGAVGDVFEVFGDGVSLGTTTPAAVGGPANSTGTFAFAIGAGTHTVDIWNFVLSFAGGPSPYGGAVDDTFSPSDLAVTIAFEVPEPASALLFVVGAAAGLAVRRRGAQKVNRGSSAHPNPT